MKKNIFTVVISAIIAFAAVTAFAAQPGSSDDPLVSKSYVDDKFNQLKALISGGGSVSAGTDINTDEIVDKVVDEVEPIIALLMKDQTGQSAGQYVPVSANVGQIVLGGEGTEIILRSGKADIYITGVAGIVNATTGKEQKNGEKAVLNNIMIIPRNDGRGLKVTENAWFLIKGDYEIK